MEGSASEAVTFLSLILTSRPLKRPADTPVDTFIVCLSDNTSATIPHSLGPLILRN